jgi:hypothetical protein
MSDNKTPQEHFDELYITGYEIQNELKVNRTTVLNARKRGLLPDPIHIPGARTCIWERATATPYIEAWKISLASRRGELA